MQAYPDTSFLHSLYSPDTHSAKAAVYFAAMKERLHLTSLNQFELVTAIKLSTFRKVISSQTADLVLQKLNANIESGALVIVPCDWAAVHGRALEITLRHTAKGGYRGFDILHVATALELGAKLFLTFDEQQAALAKTVGLKIKL